MLRLLAILVLLTPLLGCDPAPASAPEKGMAYEELIIDVDPARAATEAAELRAAAAVDVDPGFDLTLWAADSLVNDPIAVSMAPDGRLFYTRAERMKNSEFDVRGHMDWTERIMELQSVEDRRDFLRETFTAGSEQSELHLEDFNKDGVKDWRDLAVQEESVWAVSDRDGDGVADRAQRFLSDFHTEVTDVANGIEFHDGDVYITVAPDLWKAGDDDGDGTADRLESIATGFGVHVGFSGHGLSGATVGPQGRLWWGIGDIGSSVTDQDGKKWHNPNRGVVVRCDPDGSNFEVFAHGVRNTHEFAFDDYGNLITVDNDGDHPGERERLTYLIDGSDTGWRINWQYGKYTDPKNNSYKVWMDEGMSVPRHAEQAAYFLPPIQNYVNGPTGLVYNPGTALGPDWKNHFFVAEFRGAPGNSPIHAFTMEPDGAGFKLGSTKEVVRGLLPTGLDFGPDGALYFGDWINGWGAKGKGKVWRLDIAAADAGAGEVERRGTAKLLADDFSVLPTGALAVLLSHSDQRVRRKAQFALAKHDDGEATLRSVAVDGSASEMARIHAIWGLAQRVRYGTSAGDLLLPLLTARNPEILAQAARMVGDQRISGGEEQLIDLLTHRSPRVRFFAAEALGRLQVTGAKLGLVNLLKENEDKDVWLRQAAMIALGRIGDDDGSLVKLGVSHPSRSVRIGIVVALRRMQSPWLTSFLNDRDPYVVAEAARGIHDDFSVEGALPRLAELLGRDGLANEVTLRRAISANLRLGGDGNADALLAFAQRADAPATLRADALAALGTWAEPSVFDRVTGRHRGKVSRVSNHVNNRFLALSTSLLGDQAKEVRLATLAAAKTLPFDIALVQGLLDNDADADIRAAALGALSATGVGGLADHLIKATEDRSPVVRAAALELLPTADISPVFATEFYQRVIADGRTTETQAALAALAKVPGPESTELLRGYLAELRNEKFPAALRLDLVDAIENHGDQVLRKELTTFEQELSVLDSLGFYVYALDGGNPDAGSGTFYWNSSGQCTRCHAVFEYGGNVGPNLEGVGGRLSPKEILSSIVHPSAALAPGHETVLVTLNDAEETMLSGIVLKRTAGELTLRMGKTETRTIANTEIAAVETLPSSMPTADGKLSRKEIRDVVAWLATLK